MLYKSKTLYTIKKLHILELVNNSIFYKIQEVLQKRITEKQKD